MNAAPWPRTHPSDERLLVLDPERARYADLTVAALPSLLASGDVLVVNDAATLPASLRARTREGALVEVRLASLRGAISFAVDERPRSEREATCVLFGDGDWRTDTDVRPPPPLLAVGDALTFANGAGARVTAVSAASARLVDLSLDDGSTWSSLAYTHGAPVQYAYLERDLPVGLAQTPYASVPWAVEMPSAGRALTVSLLRSLSLRGVRVARLTHAAGLSATGDPQLDALLPLPERYRIPAETVSLVEEARANGRRVIAVGTTVVRALEGSVRAHDRLVAGEGVTDLIVDERFRPRVVTGVLSGMHDPGTSHAKLLSAFAPPPLLDEALVHAERERYLVHEFGDHLLVLEGALARGAGHSAAMDAAGASASAAGLASMSAAQSLKPFFFTRT